MQTTTNYNMSKPEYTDAADIAPISGNMDTIDTALHKARTRDADLYDEQTTYNIGDYCIYADVLYRCKSLSVTGAWDSTKWDATTISEAFEPKHVWQLFDTVTADGTAATLRVQLPVNVNGVFVRIQTAAAASFAQFGAVVMTTARHGIGDLPDFIQTSASYGLLKYAREGNFWEGFLSQRTGGPQGSPAITERIDNFVIDDADASYIEFRTQTSGAVLPNGSTFQIYVRR